MWTFLTFFTPQLFDFAYWSRLPLIFLLCVRVSTGIGQGDAIPLLTKIKYLLRCFMYIFVIAFHIPSIASMVSCHLTAADKGRAFGIILAGSHFGTVIAGSIGSLLLDWLGWRILFYFVGVLSLIWYWWLRVVLSQSAHYFPNVGSVDGERTLKTINKTHKVRDRTNRLQLKSCLSKPGLPATSSKVNWRILFRHPAFWLVYLLNTTFFAHYLYLGLPQLHNILVEMHTLQCSTGYLVIFMKLFQEQSYSQTYGGIFNACGAITGFIGVYIAGHILEATNNNWSYVFGVAGIQCIFGATMYGSLGRYIFIYKLIKFLTHPSASF
uniref:MFS domain-containing protein n=1 Tax=Heterorhabditis bacteriophora TaxID=37862 RepID=A0A1I7WUV7_HETBA